VGIAHRVAPETPARGSSGTRTTATPAFALALVSFGTNSVGSSLVHARASRRTDLNISASKGAHSMLCPTICPRRSQTERASTLLRGDLRYAAPRQDASHWSGLAIPKNVSSSRSWSSFAAHLFIQPRLIISPTGNLSSHWRDLDSLIRVVLATQVLSVSQLSGVPKRRPEPPRPAQTAGQSRA